MIYVSKKLVGQIDNFEIGLFPNTWSFQFSQLEKNDLF